MDFARGYLRGLRANCKQCQGGRVQNVQ